MACDCGRVGEIVTLLVLFWLFLPAVAAYGAEAPGGPTRASVVALLRHQEGIVRSVECRFRVKPIATRPEMIPLIREVCHQRGRDAEAERYLYTEDIVGRQQRTVHWWRDGIRERLEESGEGAQPASEPAETTVFDGQIVRKLSRGANEVVGSLQPSSRWNSVNRTHPVSMLYEFQNTPYSALISGAAECEIAQVTWQGKPHARVRFRHPEFSHRSFVLLLDSEGRLAERDVIVKLEEDPAPRIYEKHVFSDYVRHADSSGEPIWYPRRAVYHYYMGQLADGTPVEYTSEEIDVLDIKFNLAIPEDQFVLEFPEGTRVYDGLTGLGWLDQRAEQAKAVSAFEAIGLTRWLAVALAVAILIAIFVVLQRASRARKGSVVSR